MPRITYPSGGQLEVPNVDEFLAFFGKSAEEMAERGYFIEGLTEKPKEKPKADDKPKEKGKEAVEPKAEPKADDKRPGLFAGGKKAKEAVESK